MTETGVPTTHKPRFRVFPRQPISREELLNTVTHGFGLLLSVAGFVVLVILAALRGGAWRIASCGVYGLTLVLLYTASTAYHTARSSRWKRILKTVDHSAIYLLIAGTYTPFTLVVLRGHWGWTLFAIIWGLSLLGIIYKVCFVQHSPGLSIVLYLAMGWLAVIAVKPLLALLPGGGIFWLFAGGISYTMGVFFLGRRNLPYSHAIWHVFVLAGSVCHYLAVLYSVVRANP